MAKYYSASTTLTGGTQTPTLFTCSGAAAPVTPSVTLALTDLQLSTTSTASIRVSLVANAVTVAQFDLISTAAPVVYSPKTPVSVSQAQTITLSIPSGTGAVLVNATAVEG